MRSSRLLGSLTAVLSGAAVVVACSSTASGTGGGGCSNDYSGRWALSGSCTNTTCDVTQNACSLTVRCDDGAQGSGTVTGSSATINGLLGTGDTGGCTIRFDASKAFTMTCNSSRSQQPCSGSGSCESGSCGAPFAGSSGGSGTSGASGTSGGSGTSGTSGSSGTSGTSGTSGGVDSGPPPVTCNATPPKIFAPVPGTGPYCDTAHCAFGQRCCFISSTATIMCASSCSAGAIAIACYSGSECPSGQQCCFNATADTTSCSYLTIRGNTGSVCATSCSGSQVVACATSDECDGKTCTPAYFLKSNQTETATAQAGFCL